MGLRDWGRSLQKRWSAEGLTGVRLSTEELWWGFLRRSSPMFEDGYSIQEVWDEDIIVILDGCRYDLFREIVGEYDWLPSSTSSILSPASHSRGFSEEISKMPSDWLSSTAIFTTNDHLTRESSKTSFCEFESLSELAWDNELGRTTPDVLTDRGIEFWRKNSDKCERMVLWYMFPHAPLKPFIGDNRFFENIAHHKDERDTVWHLVRTGELTKQEVWEGYLENLRWVLEYVELLKDSVDGSILITADHGNAFGELGVYGHPYGVPIRQIRQVPLVNIVGENTGKYEPDMSEYNLESADTEERLRALGYK